MVTNSWASVPNTLSDWPGPSSNAIPITPRSAIDAAIGNMSNSSTHISPNTMKATAAGDALAASARTATAASNPKTTPSVAIKVPTRKAVNGESIFRGSAASSPTRKALAASTPMTTAWNAAPSATRAATSHMNGHVGISRIVVVSPVLVSSAAVSPSRTASRANIQNSITAPSTFSQAVSRSP